MAPWDSATTPAQAAFAAAAAVRHSIAQGNLADAYLILNSAYYAQNYNSKSPFWHLLASVIPQNAFGPSIIPFPVGTPTRLIAHSLLHGLIEHRYYKQAADLSEALVENGVKLHYRSLNKVFTLLCDPDSGAPMLEVNTAQLMSKNAFRSTLDASLVSHQGAARAFQLLQVVRQSRQRRTRKMFKLLIMLCVINGEVIMASLIFGLMTRDWNAYVAECKDLPSEAPTPYPVGEAPILEAIQQIFNDRHPVDVSHAVQALANMADLVERNSYLGYQSRTLVQLIARATQAVDFKVWVPSKTNGKLIQRDADSYFDEVLLNLTRNLPIKEGEGNRLLSVPAYKELVRYMVLHRGSFHLGEKIMHHMQHIRDPPLKDKQDLEAIAPIWAMAALKWGDESCWDQAFKFGLRGADERTRDRTISHAERFSTLILNGHRDPDFKTGFYLRVLVDLGHPDFVKPHLDLLLPSIHTHPDCSPSEHQQKQRDMRLLVSRGPEWFTLILDALYKCGFTGTMSDVWRYAKQVESFGWTIQGEKNAPAPWSLGIQAYSVMLARLAEEVEHGGKYRMVWVGGEKKLVEVPEERRRQPALGFQNRVRGDEEGVGVDVRPIPQTRYEAAYTRAWNIYRQAFSANAKYTQLVEERLGSEGRKDFHRKHEIPVPDAYFFNQMLKIVGRQEESLPKDVGLKKHQIIPAAWNRLAEAEFHFRTTGMPLKELKEDLEEVGRDIVEAGYEIPLGYREYFVGSRVDYHAEGEEGMLPRDVWWLPTPGKISPLLIL
mgnify:CR=1 FL=1